MKTASELKAMALGKQRDQIEKYIPRQLRSLPDSIETRARNGYCNVVADYQREDNEIIWDEICDAIKDWAKNNGFESHYNKNYTAIYVSWY